MKNAGEKKKCIIRTGLAEAEDLDAFCMELCDSLGVPLNLLKRKLCGQSVEYADFVFDTWRGLIWRRSGRSCWYASEGSGRPLR